MVPRLEGIDQLTKKGSNITQILYADGDSHDFYYATTKAQDHHLWDGIWPSSWVQPPTKIDKSRVAPKCTSELTVLQRNYEYRCIYVKPVEYLKHGDRLITGTPPADLITREISTCEYLRKHPHPNVCTYHGVLADGDNYVQGLVLDMYSTTLKLALTISTRSVSYTATLSRRIYSLTRKSSNLSSVTSTQHIDVESGAR